MKVSQTTVPGVLLLEPQVLRDPRGWFSETFRADKLEAAGLPRFVQENQSSSIVGTLRGLHYQLDRPQAKLVRCVRGAVFDVAVDIRVGSPTFGKWTSAVLSAENQTQIFVPVGFAHGFCVIEGPAEVIYKCSDYYSGPADQRGVSWNDPRLAIAWPVREPLLSDKDRALEPLDERRADLPRL